MITNLLGRKIEVSVWGNPPEGKNEAEILWVREHDGKVLIGVQNPSGYVEERAAESCVLK